MGLETKPLSLPVSNPPSRSLEREVSGEVMLYYNFLTGKGGKVFDRSLKCNHGIMESTYWVEDEGYPALRFNGAGFIEIGDISDLDFEWTEDFSICLWYKPFKKAFQVLICKSYTYPTPGWKVFQTYSGNVRLDLRDDAYRYNRLDSATTLEFNKWSHVAVTYSYSKSRIRIFLNGELDNERTYLTSLTTIKNTYPVRIGAFGGGSYKLTGLIRELYVVKKELSPEKIRDFYFSTKIK